MANARCRAAFESLLERAAQGTGPAPRPSLSDFLLLDGRAHEALVASDVVLLASGTAALEAMLAKRPMVVAYRVAPLTAWLLRTFGVMRTTRYSLPNVLANEPLVPELIQEQAQPQALADAVLANFRAPEHRAALAARFEELHLMLRRDANQAAAAVIAELVEQRIAPIPR
jgi:lipid-A-disaccharide synthase